MSALVAYDHVQRGWSHRLLLALAAALGIVALLVEEEALAAVLGGVAVVFVLTAASFAWLLVRDEGEHLLVRFGPLPVFRKRVRYEDIERAEVGRSTFADGWGIHARPGRGQIWNLRGFDVVQLRLRRGRLLRIGTDDPHGLLAWIVARTGGERP